MATVRTRFAPSPTGFIHIGGIYSALLDYAWAKKNHGKFILRIEDTDKKRFVEGAEAKIYEALEWVGLQPDESPQSGGPYQPYRQSERLSLYQEYAQKLVDQGDAYYCFCSPARLAEVRQQRQKNHLPPMYDKHCRDLDKKEAAARVAAGESHVIRLKVPEGEKIVGQDSIRGEVAFDSQVVDDQVLLKSDGYPTYHLAAVVDDHEMRISHVIRGEEWLSSFPKHILLYRFFGWPILPFLHTPTLRDESGKKLSKRSGHTALEWYRQEGYLPEALLNFLCLLGWSHPEGKDIFGLKEFIKYFDLSDLSPAGPFFDIKKLTWMNGVYIRQQTDRQLLQLLKPFAPEGMSDTLIEKTVPLIRERISKLSDYAGMVDFLIKAPVVDKALLLKKSRQDEATIRKQLELTAEKLAVAENWQTEKLEELCRQLAAENNYHVGKFFMALRIAVTGKAVTPPLFASLAILGKQDVLERLKKVISSL